MSNLLLLLLAWAIVLVVNVVPAFMPPSWSIMAVFRVTAGLPLLPLTIGGAAMSAVGRAGLALLSRRLSYKLPDTDRQNAEALGQFLNRHRRWRTLIVFGYCLGPLPSNAVFIAAGAGKVPLLPVTLAFFLSRAIADTFWVWTVDQVSHNLSDVFAEQITSWKAVVVQVATIVLVVLLFRLPWRRWLGGDAKVAGTPPSGEPAPAGAGRNPAPAARRAGPSADSHDGGR